MYKIKQYIRMHGDVVHETLKQGFKSCDDLELLDFQKKSVPVTITCGEI
jgi:hypothetical protein